jgi:hypothetical protein
MPPPDAGRDSDDDEGEVAVPSPVSRHRRKSHTGKAPEAEKTALNTAIALAEKYFDRFESTQFLKLLPSKAPLAAVAKYLSIVIEFKNTKKRNLQVLQCPYFLSGVYWH